MAKNSQESYYDNWFYWSCCIAFTNLRSIKENISFLINSANEKTLQIVDVTFSDKDSQIILGSLDSFCIPQILDIKVRNNGNEVVFIKRASLVVKRAWKGEYDNINWMNIEPSSISPMDLVKDGPGKYFSLITNLSLEVLPQRVDRFKLVFQKSRNQLESFFLNYIIYCADLIIEFNENKNLIFRNVIFTYADNMIISEDQKHEIKSLNGLLNPSMKMILD